MLKTTFGLDSNIIFKHLSSEYSPTSDIVDTLRLLPKSFSGNTVSLYTIVLFTTVALVLLILAAYVVAAVIAPAAAPGLNAILFPPNKFKVKLLYHKF